MDIYEQKLDSHFSQLLATDDFQFVNDFLLHNSELQLYVVGGAVRDILLDIVVGDYDFVVIGLEEKQLELFLSARGSVVFVGKQFGVYKFTPNNSDKTFDIALPRTERSTGPGYADFEIFTDHTLSISEDLERRDFTVNAFAYNLRDRSLIDDHDGLMHLSEKRLVAVGDPQKRFTEDYVRVLRAVRFAVQLEFTIDEKTAYEITAVVNSLTAETIPVSYEMIAEEFFASMHFNALLTIDLYDELGLLSLHLPEVAACKGVTQEPDSHPEVDLFEHIRITLSKLEDGASLRLRLAALFHDIGKVSTRKIKEVKGKNRITFYDHEKVGAEQFRGIARRFVMSKRLADDVWFLIRNHLYLWHGAYNEIRTSKLYEMFLKDYALGKDLIALHYVDLSRTDAELEKERSYLDEAQIYIESLRERLGAVEDNFPLSGSDVITRFNLVEGPVVGEYLQVAREEYIAQKAKGIEISKEDLLVVLEKHHG